MSESIEESNAVSPAEVCEHLERDIQTLNKRVYLNFVRGDRAPRDVLIEHYTAIRDHIDGALQMLKGEDET